MVPALQVYRLFRCLQYRRLMSSCRTTLQGRLKSAGRILSTLTKELSSSEQFSQTKAMSETLRLLDSYPNAASDLFKQRFKKWSDNCQLLLATLDVSDTATRPLYTLLRILSGEKAAIRENALHWKDELIGTLLYSYPTMTVNELGYFSLFFSHPDPY